MSKNSFGEIRTSGNSNRLPLVRNERSHGQSIAVGVVDRGKHAAFRLHGAEMLTDNFQVTVTEKPAINRGAGCELADKFAWLLPRHKPLAKRWLPLVVLGHSDALRVVGPAITSD